MTTTTAVDAWRGNRLTVGWSGGGFMLSYHLGVYQALAAMRIVTRDTPMAGSSAGALVVAGIKTGLTLQQQMDSFVEVAADCRQHGVSRRLRRVLKAQLNKTMPEDAAARFSDGTAWVSVTQILPRAVNKLYGAFDTRQALLKALLISSHLPRLSDGSVLTGSHKGAHKRCFDGGFSNLVPVPPVLEAADAAGAAAAGGASSDAMVQRTSSTKGISTPLTLSMQPNSLSSHGNGSSSHSSSSSSSSSGTAQHHHVQGSRGLAVLGLSRRRPGPSPEEALAASCRVEGAGAYIAAPGWFAVRVCVLPARHLHELPQLFKAPAAHEVSIAVDKFQAWPHDLDATTKLALAPQADDFLWELFERGAADAAAWARQQGFPEEVLRKLADGAALSPELHVVRRPPPVAGQQLQPETKGAAGREQQQEQQPEEDAVAAVVAGLQQAQLVKG